MKDDYRPTLNTAMPKSDIEIVYIIVGIICANAAKTQRTTNILTMEVVALLSASVGKTTETF
jgi:hypothetical protein